MTKEEKKKEYGALEKATKWFIYMSNNVSRYNANAHDIYTSVCSSALSSA
jgi:hypothetical protein